MHWRWSAEAGEGPLVLESNAYEVTPISVRKKLGDVD